jgi:hypothetical protein
MTAPPLTHHEILALVEPFSRKGHRVDLAATDRTARKVVFRPVDHAAAADTPAMRETLELENLGTGSFKLTRKLAGTAESLSLNASLQASGTDPGELLTRLDTVPRTEHFRLGPRYAIARSYAFDAFASGTPQAPSLHCGVVHVDGLTLTFDVLPLRESAADLTLEPIPGEVLPLPEDLLAVLGWDWARLVPQTGKWTSRMRLRGKGAPRTRVVERALEKAARHLASVLSEPPARFHERFFWARWGSVCRRLIPTFTAVGMIAGALLLTRMATTVKPGILLALHYVPIGILGMAFTLQELPRFEIPPWPRRLPSPRWRQPETPSPTGAPA